MQMEALQLASESSARQMEAELASIKRDAAQAAAMHKQAYASWHARIDQCEAEVKFPAFCVEASKGQVFWKDSRNSCCRHDNTPRVESCKLCDLTCLSFSDIFHKLAIALACWRCSTHRNPM